MNVLPFRQARWYTATVGREVRCIVLHTTEGGGTAASNQAMFATWERVVSAHFLIGTDGVAPCVLIKDVAYASPGANHDGIQIEQIGRASWSRTEWLEQHNDILTATAELLASLAADCDIPLASLNAAALLRGDRGITTHAQVTAAWPDRGDGHWDPGPGYPLDVVLARAAEFLNDDQPPQQEDDMPAYPFRLARSRGSWKTARIPMSGDPTGIRLFVAEPDPSIESPLAQGARAGLWDPAEAEMAVTNGDTRIDLTDTLWRDLTGTDPGVPR